MKKISVFFCAVCVALLTCFPVFADVITPTLPGQGSLRAVWAVIVSAVTAAATFIWHLLTRNK